MKKFFEYFKAVVSLALIVLEILPSGAAMILQWPDSEGKFTFQKQLYSYFNYNVGATSNNYLPFITAIVSCILLILTILAIIKVDFQLNKVIMTIAVIGFLTSLPLMYGLFSYTLIGLIISVLLAGIVFLCYIEDKKTAIKKLAN